MTPPRAASPTRPALPTRARRVALATALLLPVAAALVPAPASAAACDGTVATIGSVQGSTDNSPSAGQVVTVRGVVVGDDEGAAPALGGFYLQDQGDGDAATSDGVFVFDRTLGTAVANGDQVEVTGTVSEFQGQTQVTPTAVTPCGTGDVSPTEVTLPMADATAFERYEGMLVRFAQTLSVTEHFQLGRFGEVVLSSGGRLPQPTAVASPGADARSVQAQNDLNRIKVDDALNNQNADPIRFGRGGQPLSASNTLRGGDTTTGLTGVLTYTWAGNAASPNAYRLRPLEALHGSALFDPTNPRPSGPPAVGGDLKVASANLLNLFDTFTGCTLGVGGATTDCRGADNATELERQLAKEVAALTSLDADVLAVMELQNDGYGPDSTLQLLVDRLNAATEPGRWAFVDADAATGVVNAAGTDAIRVALLYRTDRVTPVPGHTFTDTGSDLWERRPVATEFHTAGGENVTVVANHFKSKGSCPASGPDTDQQDGQSCWNARRTLQAQRLLAFVHDTVVGTTGDPDVLLVGDFNSYDEEDPVGALEDGGFTDLAGHFHGDEAYSYAFDGQWGYLDYAFASPSLLGQVTGAEDSHINADEPAVLDYNTNFKSPGQVASLYAPDRFRTSDHDPVRVGLTLDTTAPSLTWQGGIADGGHYPFGSVPAAPTCTAGDAGSGPAACTVSGWSSAVGTHTLTATAYDVAGNSTVQTRTYVVDPWTLRGFRAPVDNGGVLNVVKRGAKVPLRFEVFAGGTELTSTSVVSSVRTTGIACPDAREDKVEETTRHRVGLRYVDGRFEAVWKAPSTKGCRVVTVTTADGSRLRALFRVR